MLTKRAELLLEAIRRTKKIQESEHGPFIHVSEAISTAASLYERVRNLVDFRAEHLLRKTAIQRILKRRIVFFGQREGLAESVVRELIRARHLTNDKVPETRIAEVDQVLQKYIAALDFLNQGRISTHPGASWLVEMCAVELEEVFAPHLVEHALVQMFFDSVQDHVETPGLDDETKNFQLYIAAYKALRKSDAFMAEFHLLRMYLPGWFMADVKVDQAMADGLLKSRDAVIAQLNHPIGKRYLAQMKKVVAPFLLVENLVKEKGEELEAALADPLHFNHEVGKAIEKRYKVEGERLWRRGFRALIYIFLTKIIVGVLLELPYDFWVLKAVHPFPLAVNVVWPPLLLFGILVSLRKPDKKNTAMIEQAMKEVFYEAEEPQVFRGRKRLVARRKSGLRFFLYTALYASLFVFSFGVIIALLRRLDFSAMSVALFLVFTSIVSFFGVNLRQNAKELIIVAGKEKLVVVLFDILTLPIVSAGRWISANVNRINIFLFILDVIIEAPFQFLIEATESWFDFLREKKEEI